MANYITDIPRNPFRILDVYADASQKDILANKGKISALGSVGKGIKRTLSMDGLLPQLTITSTDVDEAFRQLHLPSSKVKHALMWFLRPEDETFRQALEACSADTLPLFENHLLSMEGDAVPLWLLHDTMLLCLLAEKYTDAYLYLIKLSPRVDEWLSCVGCEVVGLNSEGLIQILIDIADANNITIDIESKLADAFSQLTKLVRKVEKKPKNIYSLYDESKRLLPLLKMAPKGLEHYYLDIANKIAEALIVGYGLLTVSQRKQDMENEILQYIESIMYGTSLTSQLEQLKEKINQGDSSELPRGCYFIYIIFSILIIIAVVNNWIINTSSYYPSTYNYQEQLVPSYEKLDSATIERLQKMKEAKQKINERAEKKAAAEAEAAEAAAEATEATEATE